MARAFPLRLAGRTGADHTVDALGRSVRQPLGADRRSPHAKAGWKIPGRIQCIVSFAPLSRTAGGWLISPMFAQGLASSIQRSLRTCSHARLWDGRFRIRCALKPCRYTHRINAITSARKTMGLVHHSDHGSQYVSVVYNERYYRCG